MYDPYMGSGPLALACIAKGINYIGCEIVPEYYQVARERIQKALLG